MEQFLLSKLKAMRRIIWKWWNPFWRPKDYGSILKKVCGILRLCFQLYYCLDLREPIINEESFGLYNNFQPVASNSDRKFGTYQFGYFMADRGTCKNARGPQILAAICFKEDRLSEDVINFPLDLKYFILIGVFTVTFTLWSVATKCGNIISRTRSCFNNDVDNNVE